MGNFYMESTQINYRRDDKLKTVDQKLQELSETSAIDTDIAPVFKSTNTYQPGDMVYYRNKLYVFNVEHTGTWAAADVTATDVTTEISLLKSGLTNVDVALSVPENTGKNVLPLTLANLKSQNTTGTWSGNAYTVNGVTFTVQTDGEGNVTGITANGTASGESDFYLDGNVSKTKYSGCIMSGCVGGSSSTYYIQYIQESSPWKNQKQTNDSIQLSEFPENIKVTIRIVVSSGVELTDKVFYPMIRPATITDATFAPYIPSVESRIEAVESGLTNLIVIDTKTVTTDSDGDASLDITTSQGIIISVSAVGVMVEPWVHSGDYKWYVRVKLANGNPLVGDAPITYAYVPLHQ